MGYYVMEKQTKEVPKTICSLQFRKKEPNTCTVLQIPVPNRDRSLQASQKHCNHSKPAVLNSWAFRRAE